MKKQRQTELPRFVVGALATAGASMANAATVQITFAGISNSVFSTAQGGLASFTPDLTGDGVADGLRGSFGVDYGKLALLAEGGQLGFASFRAGAGPEGGNLLRASVLGGGAAYPIPGGLAASAFIPFSFTDVGINSGGITNGYLAVSAGSGTRVGDGVLVAGVIIHRLVFDDASTVAPPQPGFGDSAFPEFVAIPEPSSLGLLALGAGGLLARRRRIQATA